ncbi:hypothetical protein [Deinococcus multiflagellatus]|uniref:hypothetical protein n=1 Tax=Deinococcus multiflagellatus TaxID=1656887 RepID=UPI001CCFC853|nr:hypothetical protein [Deinococcus multiflagellatus]MBZ9712110.1 hypothetical protein [Deinococcus multiflagellatus]
MHRFAPRLFPVLLSGLLAGAAQAATLEFGVAYSRPGSPLWARAGISDVEVLGGTAAFGVGNRGADLSYGRGLALPPLGAVSARSSLLVTWQGGVRAGSRVTGSLGPVALNLGLSAFTVAAQAADPLAPFAEAPTDLRERGLSGDVAVRYRLSRDLVAVAGGEFGAQPHLLAGVEGRRVLTRAVSAEAEAPAPESAPTDSAPADEAPAEEAPAAEPEQETVGTLSWRLGARAGRGVLGLSGGLGYATESGLSLGLDALVGPQTFGVTGSVSAAEVLGEGSTLRLYAAYEPWRTASTPLRAGLEATWTAGPGTLALNVSGGRTRSGGLGYGARVSYALPLGTQP